MALSEYGGAPGGITHVVLTGRRLEAEDWILRKQIPRKAVLVVMHTGHLLGVHIPESARVKRTASFYRLKPATQTQIEDALRRVQATSG